MFSIHRIARIATAAAGAIVLSTMSIAAAVGSVGVADARFADLAAGGAAHG